MLHINTLGIFSRVWLQHVPAKNLFKCAETVFSSPSMDGEDTVHGWAPVEFAYGKFHRGKKSM